MSGTSGKVMQGDDVRGMPTSTNDEIRYDESEFDLGHTDDNDMTMKIGEVENDMISIMHPWLMTWDTVVLVCVAYSALTVPYEAAFLTFDLQFYTGQLVLNLIVSLIFAADCLLYFYIPFFSGHVWVYNSRTIKRNYVNGWFLADFIGLLPWFLIPVIAGATFFTRLPSMLQMLRMFKLERIFRRVETNVRIYYSSTQILYYFTSILLITHWMACLWVFQLYRPQANDFEADTNWITAKFAEGDETYLDVWARLGHWRIYVSAFYWACMTVSTIGYGDIVPVDAVERMIASLFMMVGAGAYGYVIGAFSSVIASRDSRQNHFHLVMDELNMFMEIGKVPKSLRQKLREFFRFKFMNRGVHSYNALLTDMSPALRSEVVLYINAPWVRKVHLFQNCPSEMVTLIAFALEQEAFPPRELLIKSGEISNKLYIIKSGVIASPTRVYIKGQVLGEDCLAISPQRRYYNARTMTYVDVYVLHLRELNEILQQFPTFKRMMAKAHLKRLFHDEVMAFTRAYKQLCEEVERGGEHRRRFSWLGDMDDRVEYFKSKLRLAGFSKGGMSVHGILERLAESKEFTAVHNPDHHKMSPLPESSSRTQGESTLNLVEARGIPSSNADMPPGHLADMLRNIYEDLQRIKDAQGVE